MEFQIVKKGYNPEQVNRTIATLLEKYQALYAQYTELEAKHADIGNALISAGAAAQALIEKAETEANAIQAKTKIEIAELLARRRMILTEARHLFENELKSLPTK